MVQTEHLVAIVLFYMHVVKKGQTRLNLQQHLQHKEQLSSSTDAFRLIIADHMMTLNPVKHESFSLYCKCCYSLTSSEFFFHAP